MLTFRQFIAESEKIDEFIDPISIAVGVAALHGINKVTQKPKAHSSINAHHQHLANRIDNSKSHNFISRAIAHGRLNDRMAKLHNKVR